MEHRWKCVRCLLVVTAVLRLLAFFLPMEHTVSPGLFRREESTGYLKDLLSVLPDEDFIRVPRWLDSEGRLTEFVRLITLPMAGLALLAFVCHGFLRRQQVVRGILLAVTLLQMVALNWWSGQVSSSAGLYQREIRAGQWVHLTALVTFGLALAAPPWRRKQKEPS